MTENEKQLLLKDLCARLPYGVIVDVSRVEEWKQLTLTPFILSNYYDDIEKIKSYLRPMSSMTEEEFELLKQYSGLEYDQLDLAEFPNNHKCLDFYLSEVPSDVVILVFDWLNAHHFDYRLLIERGLALEATEGMYKTE